MADSSKLIDELIDSRGEENMEHALERFHKHVQDHGALGQASGFFVAGWNAALELVIAKLHNASLEKKDS